MDLSLQLARVWTARRPDLLACAVILCVSVLPPAVLAGRLHAVGADGERLDYATWPERGYVVKLSEKAGEDTVWDQGATDARPVGGVRPHPIWVVQGKHHSQNVSKTMTRFREGEHAEYVAPLFRAGDQAVAILPEIVVRMTPEGAATDLERLCRQMDLAVVKKMEFTEREFLLQVSGADAEAVFAAATQLRQASFIEWAVPNVASQLHLCDAIVPNDEHFGQQWHLQNRGQWDGRPGADINVLKAWDITTGDPNIVVAVLDTGVDANHPDLRDNLVPGYDFLEADSIPEPDRENLTGPHGTACAGLVAARGNNGIGVAGVVWHCKIMPIRIGSGGYDFITDADRASAIRWAAAHGADILSNSWAEGLPLPVTHSALKDVTKPGGMGRGGKGCVVVCSAGNKGGPLQYPALYRETIAVGAIDNWDRQWHYSNYGPELDLVASSGCWIDYCAEPFPMWTTDISGLDGWNGDNMHDPAILDYTDTMGGTSGACPLVAGAAALVLSVDPSLTSEEVRHVLLRSARDLGEPGRDIDYGWGAVDTRAALDVVLARKADLNHDQRVDLDDLSGLAGAWMTETALADIGPATARDRVVNLKDLSLLAQYWLAEIPELGLVAHWPLDEAGGDLACDRVGGCNATLSGRPVWQPTGGRIGGALRFNGVDSCVQSGFVINPGKTPFSLRIWIRGGRLGQVILSQQGGANWLATHPEQGWLGTDLQPSDARGAPLWSQTVVNDGRWHRVGFVWTGAERVLFVDDREVARDEPGSLHGSAGGLNIGAGADLAAESFWSGWIDDVRIYDGAIAP